jgi:hypothetical protein
MESGQLVSGSFSRKTQADMDSWQLDLLITLSRHASELVDPPDQSAFVQTLQQIIFSHLFWVFKCAERPQGHWARSYFATGVPKDQIFQLDQQCYPLLELAQFGLQSAKHAKQIRGLAKDTVDDILACLMRHRWTAPPGGAREQLWLFTTDETPADDAVAFPYHFSSHILLWYTLVQLAKLRDVLGEEIIRTPVADWAIKVHKDTLDQFTIDDPTTGPIFAYLVSTQGEYQLYHDANDLPTVLAPQWGFCSESDPVWQETISFAFSSRNEGGWYPGGRFGGLGSVHTPDPWPLGDAQGLVLSGMKGESSMNGRREKILEKLANVVQWDGIFSEAVDRYSGVVTSKSWFSWPGAFISSILLKQALEIS